MWLLRLLVLIVLVFVCFCSIIFRVFLRRMMLMCL